MNIFLLSQPGQRDDIQEGHAIDKKEENNTQT
jgi:hypothetical protein